ncbi:tRNA-Phe hydroxylase [Aureococcus anophagefferens]|nr:tRNA-Phe hydroxylase [Aureococcus anophagefferens]
MGILKRRTLIVPGAALTAMQKRRRKPLPFRHLFVGPPSPLMQSKRTKLQQLFCASKKADAVVEGFAPPPPRGGSGGSRGLHAFTRAYRRPLFNAERASASAPPRACGAARRVADLAAALPRLPAARTSWRDFAGALRGVRGFGGSGFMAKEVLLDAAWWPSVAARRDAGDFTLVGPGARGPEPHRGAGRRLGSRAREALAEARFLEVRLVHAFCVAKPAWCAARNIDIHDVQFQLCEFDKYERVKSASAPSDDQAAGLLEHLHEALSRADAVGALVAAGDARTRAASDPSLRASAPAARPGAGGARAAAFLRDEVALLLGGGGESELEGRHAEALSSLVRRELKSLLNEAVAIVHGTGSVRFNFDDPAALLHRALRALHDGGGPAWATELRAARCAAGGPLAFEGEDEARAC